MKVPRRCVVTVITVDDLPKPCTDLARASNRRFHRRQRIRLPNETIHAAVHVIAENQVALGDAFPAQAVLFRLMKEGLDRHEAIHAMGFVLSEKLFAVMSEQEAEGDLNPDYMKKLKSLTAESWSKQAS